jgi:ComF family protein
MKIKIVKNFIFDCLFPIYCVNCQSFIPAAKQLYLCDNCLDSIVINSGFICPICFRRVVDFKKCLHSNKKSHLDFLGSALFYDHPVIKNLIHQFKYQYIKEIAFTLANFLNVFWTKTTKTIEEDWGGYIVIPIPLHKKRLCERGFNQSEEIAKIFAHQFNFKILDNILIRKVDNPPQAKIENYEQRYKNIKNIFEVRSPGLINGQNIILIDDVFTSGATLQEAAKILKNNGAKKIIGLTIAR